MGFFWNAFGSNLSLTDIHLDIYLSDTKSALYDIHEVMVDVGNRVGRGNFRQAPPRTDPSSIQKRESKADLLW